jgi:hypothetical protein
VVAVACSAPDYSFVPNPPTAPHCENSLFEPARGETDVDCGGPDCRGCELGSPCLENTDCLEGECLESYCQEPGCDNQVVDSTETDIDCGGDCKPCTTGQACLVPRDCESSICESEVCAAPSCSDRVLNGLETGRDCGGPDCDGCPPGSPCVVASDCTSGVCDENTMRCVVFCVQGTDECDADLTEECETNVLTSSEHCGACGNVCEFDNAVAGCSGGECRIETCEAPWGNCNEDPDDGCETDTSATASDCGGCGRDCPDINGTPRCEDSACAIDCDEDHADCNGEPADGCEADVSGDVLHCGDCDEKCPEEPGNTAYCLNGECGETMCEAGYGNCNGDPDDGCEQDLTSVAHCGRCGGQCNVAHGTAGCDADLGCTVAACDDGWDNCNTGDPDGGYSDGCEVNLETSADDCGACGNACSVEQGTGVCVAGECEISGCEEGWSDCDGDYANGCEIDTASDEDNCGGCGPSGVQCNSLFPNATGQCVGGTCVLDDCLGSYADCTSEVGCETNTQSSNLHCGGCGEPCQSVGGTNTCTSGVCVPECNAGWDVCTSPENGCTQLNASPNCGECDNSCSGNTATCVPVSGGTARCQSTITLVNRAGNQVQGNSLNVTHALQTGQSRLILVAVAADSGNQGINGSRPDSVTYGGTAMTLAAEQAGYNDWWSPDLFIYVLGESGLAGKSGNQTVFINGATAPSPNVLVADVLELAGVRQATPVSASAGTVGGNPDPPDPTTVSNMLTLSTTGSRIYSFASAEWLTNGACPGDGGCPTGSVTPSTGLTVTSTINSPTVGDNSNAPPTRAFGMFVGATSGTAPASGTYTPTWVFPNAGRLTHLAVVIHPAVAP